MLEFNRQLNRTGSTEPVGTGTRCRSLVLGLGATGLSLVRYASARGDVVVVADTRAEPPSLAALRDLCPDCRPLLGEFSTALLENVDRLLVSPGIASSNPLLEAARERGIPIGSDIGLFTADAAALDVPVIGITGSNGKSTVTTMVADMLAHAGLTAPAGGNLGPPALELISDAGTPPDFFVIELSSFQLDLCPRPVLRVGALLNISADHIDRHGDLERYAASKAAIFSNCEYAVANRDDPMVMSRIPAGTPARRFGLGRADEGDYGLLGIGLDDRRCQLARGDEALMPIGELRVTGRHNLLNALAALAIADAIAAPMSRCIEALANYRGLPHRTQLVTEVDGVRWIDDSKATNVGATVAAVSGLQGPLVLIAGGQGKGQDFAPLAIALKGKVRDVVVLGEDAGVLASTLAPVCPVHRVDSMRAAVETAGAKARRGDTVLLSPACGSQDMFRDYRERGEQFANEVLGRVT